MVKLIPDAAGFTNPSSLGRVVGLSEKWIEARRVPFGRLALYSLRVFHLNRTILSLNGGQPDPEQVVRGANARYASKQSGGGKSRNNSEPAKY